MFRVLESLSFSFGPIRLRTSDDKSGTPILTGELEDGSEFVNC